MPVRQPEENAYYQLFEDSLAFQTVSLLDMEAAVSFLSQLLQ